MQCLRGPGDGFRSGSRGHHPDSECARNQRIFFPEQVALGIVAGAIGTPGSVGDFDRQCPVPQVADVFATPQWIARLDQAADVIIAVVPFAALWIDTLHQLPGDDFLLPAIAEGIDMLVDLVERAPIVMVLTTEVVGDVGFTPFQVAFELVLFAVATPMANDAPFVIGLWL